MTAVMNFAPIVSGCQWFQDIPPTRGSPHHASGRVAAAGPDRSDSAGPRPSTFLWRASARVSRVAAQQAFQCAITAPRYRALTAGLDARPERTIARLVVRSRHLRRSNLTQKWTRRPEDRSHVDPALEARIQVSAEGCPAAAFGGLESPPSPATPTATASPTFTSNSPAPSASSRPIACCSAPAVPTDGAPIGWDGCHNPLA
jgi:hypothetical protein